MSVPDGFDFVDVPGEQGNPVQTSTDLRCEFCGTGLIYAGRGAKPRFCDEHKTAKLRGEGESRPVGRPSGKGAQVVRAVDTLTFGYRAVGTAVGYVDKSTSLVIVDAAPTLAASYTRLLETNDRFLKLFAEAEDKLAWLPILIAHGSLAMAIVAARAQPTPGPSPTRDVADESFAAANPYDQNVYNFPPPRVADDVV